MTYNVFSGTLNPTQRKAELSPCEAVKRRYVRYK